MITIICCLMAGIAVGRLIKGQIGAYVSKTISLLIWLLLFLLGLSIGANESVFMSFASLGVDALIIGTAATAGSAAASWVLWKYIKGKEA